MDLAQAQAWTVIIVATGGAIASVISAIRSGKIVSDTNRHVQMITINVTIAHFSFK